MIDLWQVLPCTVNSEHMKESLLIALAGQLCNIKHFMILFPKSWVQSQKRKQEIKCLKAVKLMTARSGPKKSGMSGLSMSRRDFPLTPLLFLSLSLFSLHIPPLPGWLSQRGLYFLSTMKHRDTFHSC